MVSSVATPAGAGCEAGTPDSYQREQSVFTDLVNEMDRARRLHRDMTSPHEAIAVIREEYLEAEREVFQKHVDRAKLRKELIQTANVCLRAVIDLRLEPGS